MKLTPNGIPVLELDEIGSTNAEAMRLGLAGAATPLWVRADRQSSGRGRSGREWTSAPGNHYASLLTRLTCPPTMLHQLSFVAAIATVAALRRVIAEAVPEGHGDHGSRACLQGRGELDRRGPPAVGALSERLRIKWPNDILIDGAKLVGILPESTILPDTSVLAVIGIGINIAHAPEGLGRATTSLAALGVSISPQAMLDALAVEMGRALLLWGNGAAFTAIRDLWQADALPLGTAMSVHTGRDKIDGTFAGLDLDGALILRDHSGYDRRMTFGDVTVNAAESGRG